MYCGRRIARRRVRDWRLHGWEGGTAGTSRRHSQGQPWQLIHYWSHWTVERLGYLTSPQ